METRVVEQNGQRVAIVTSAEPVLAGVHDALDLMATVEYETGCVRIAIEKSAVAEDFFVLSTRLAGDILQKFVNYRKKIAVFGDFSRYTSKPLRDFHLREQRRKRRVLRFVGRGGGRAPRRGEVAYGNGKSPRKNARAFAWQIKKRQIMPSGISVASRTMLTHASEMIHFFCVLGSLS